MQKIVGCILIIIATAGSGILYGKDLKAYLEKLQYLRYMFSVIQGEILYSYAPLPDVFFSVAKRVKEPYRNWLVSLAKEMETRDSSGFARIWNKCVEKDLSELHLKKEHRMMIKEAGTFMGCLESKTLERAMQLYLNRMDLEIEKLRQEISSKMKIGKYIGIMGGLFLIIVLI